MTNGMPLDPETPAAGESDDGWPSVEEFARWLAEDPAHLAAFEKLTGRIARGELGDVPAEMLGAIRAFMAKRHEERCLAVVSGKLKALQEVMQRPAGTMRAKDQLAECKGLMEEITDALLDTPEPHRTRFLKELVPVREKLRTLQVNTP